VQAARDKARAFDESIGGKPAELDREVSQEDESHTADMD